MSKSDNQQPIIIHDSDGFLPGLLLGGLLGGGAYFLFYTKKGKELAKELFNIGKEEIELFQKGEYKLPESLLDKSGELGEDLKDVATKVIDHLSQKYKELQENSPEIVSGSVAKVQQLAKKVISQEDKSKNLKKEAKSTKTPSSKITVAPKKRFKRIVKTKSRFFAKKGKSLAK